MAQPPSRGADFPHRREGAGSRVPTQPRDRSAMPIESLTLTLTERQAEALRALAALEELPPEVYAAEVLVKHLYHSYTPDVQRRFGAGDDH